MNNIYEENLQVIKEYRSDIYEVISAKDFSYNPEGIEVETAKNEERIIVKTIDNQKIYLNSRYNPSNEAKRYMEEYADMQSEAILAVFGISNCSFLREFMNINSNGATCFAYEPDISLFMKVLYNIDIRDIIKCKNIIIAVKGINDKWINAWLSDNVKAYNRSINKHITLPQYRNIYKEEYEYFKNVLSDTYDTVQIYQNTITRVGRVACENSIYNMRYIKNSRSLIDYKGAFPEDMPGIVVSAGPSLAKNVDLLKKAKGKSLIICTDSAVDKVVSTGIYPDIVISVDFAKPLGLFTAENLSKVPFLADTELNKKVIETLNPETLIYYATDENIYNKLLRDIHKTDESYDMETGGSVATAAIAAFIYWGFKKIILIGQDLAFTGNKIHVDSDETFEFDSNTFTYVKGIDGDMLPVRKDYYQYIGWIENAALIFGDVEIIDATEGGALKKHTNIMTFSEAIDKYCSKSYDNIDEIIKAAPKRFEGENYRLVTDKFKNYIRELKSMKIKLDNTASDCSLASHMMKNGDFNRKKLKDINRNMDKTDKVLLDAETNPYIFKFAAKAEYDFGEDMYIEESNDIDEAIRLYEKSADYYKSLAESIPDIIVLMENCLKEMGEDA